MLSQGKLRRTICILLVAFTFISSLLIIQNGLYEKFPKPRQRKPEISPSPKPTPLYKPRPDPPPDIEDNFPLAATAKSPSDLPDIPSWNKPPETHVDEHTALFIGFTRNWRLLQQVVVSYITAGWPPGDIYVVDNSGVMHSNRDGLLGLQNPFYIDYTRLTAVFGINVLTTPTLLTFAQLQNFFTYTALEKDWDTYYWAHMDSPAISDEEFEEEGQPYQSIYMRAVAVMRESMKTDSPALAMRWFSYDRLELVRTKAFVDVGGWDTLIPYYMTDCDMHERLWMKNFSIETAKAGLIYDVAESVDNLEMFYRRKPKIAKREEESQPPPEPPTPVTKSDGRNSPEYHELLKKLDELQRAKSEDKGGRNTWQARQHGGQGEPFYRDGDGFELGIQMTMTFGRDVFEAKWGRGPCDIRDAGLKEDDAWRVVPGWEKEEIQKQAIEDRKNEAMERLKKEKEEEKKPEA